MNIALVGSGLYAGDAYLPAILAQSKLHLVAIYSRTIESASKLLTKLPLESRANIRLYSNLGGQESSGTYQELLQDLKVVGLIIALPIQVQAEFVSDALRAGKHVLSEKPIAHSIASAAKLISEHELSRRSCAGQVWFVAENWRLLPAVGHAAEHVRKLGRVLGFRTRQGLMMGADSPFLATGWRTSPELGPGPLLLDGAVHGIAVLRHLLGPEESLSRLCAFSQSLQPHLPAPDSLDAVVTTKSGITGVMQMSYGTTFSGPVFEVACAGGVVLIEGFDSVVVTSPEGSEIGRWTGDAGLGRSVASVLDAWGDAINGEGNDTSLAPSEALIDLKVIKGMLESAEKGGAPVGLVV